MVSNTAAAVTTAAQTVDLSGLSATGSTDTTTETTFQDNDSAITYTGAKDLAIADTVVLNMGGSTAGTDTTAAISITDSHINTVADNMDTLKFDALDTFTNLTGRIYK